MSFLAATLVLNKFLPAVRFWKLSAQWDHQTHFLVSEMYDILWTLALCGEMFNGILSEVILSHALHYHNTASSVEGLHLYQQDNLSSCKRWNYIFWGWLGGWEGSGNGNEDQGPKVQLLKWWLALSIGLSEVESSAEPSTTHTPKLSATETTPDFK